MSKTRSTTLIGEVVFFNYKKNLGSIEIDEGTMYYFHTSDISDTKVEAGDRVKFQERNTNINNGVIPRRLFATNIRSAENEHE